MDEVEMNILAAWERVLPRLLSDQHELAKRLARRRRPCLRRPPRAWCIAVRAGDKRIPANHCSPCGQTGERQEVRLDVELLRALSAPVWIDIEGEPPKHVAAKLGVSIQSLLTVRCNGTWRTEHIKGWGGVRGYPVPFLSNGGRSLDPGANTFKSPPYLWSWTAPYRYCRVPHDFCQTIVRAPFYRSHAPAARYQEYRHPEVDGVAMPRRRGAPKRLPRMGPDVMAWYKWKGDEYIGYDWRAAQTNPLIREDYERFERRRARQMELYYERRRREGPARRASTSGGSLHFNGWLWICPVCGRTCRRIFYPVPTENVLWPLPRLAEIIDIPPLLPGVGFACVRCHRPSYLPQRPTELWNFVVSYLTGGLMYGTEVEPPKWSKIPPHKPQPAGKSRRAEVTELLMQGLSFRQIALELGVTKGTVETYVVPTYRQHGVRGREELARRLGRVVADRARLVESPDAPRAARALRAVGRPVVRVN